MGGHQHGQSSGFFTVVTSHTDTLYRRVSLLPKKINRISTSDTFTYSNQTDRVLMLTEWVISVLVLNAVSGVKADKRNPTLPYTLSIQGGCYLPILDERLDFGSLVLLWLDLQSRLSYCPVLPLPTRRSHTTDLAREAQRLKISKT